jgi:hypothetical protein
MTLHTLSVSPRLLGFIVCLTLGSFQFLSASVSQYQGTYIGNAFLSMQGVVTQPETVTGVTIAEVDAGGNLTLLDGTTGVVNASGAITWSQPNGLNLNSGQIEGDTLHGNGSTSTQFVTTLTRIQLVRQGGATAPNLSLEETTREHGSAAVNQASVAVTSNVAWTATVGFLQDWITLDNGSASGNGTLVYSLSENTGTQRSGTITVTAGGVNRNLSIIQEGAAPWYAGAVDLGSGWRWLNWLGAFNITSEPWIYHAEHGWLFPLLDGLESFFLWDNEMQSFLWTSPNVYPSMFRFSDAQWIYYQVGSDNPRWFINLQTSQWEQW